MVEESVSCPIEEFKRQIRIAVAKGEMHSDTGMRHIEKIEELVASGELQKAEKYAQKTPGKVGFKNREGWWR